VATPLAAIVAQRHQMVSGSNQLLCQPLRSFRHYDASMRAMRATLLVVTSCCLLPAALRAQDTAAPTQDPAVTAKVALKQRLKSALSKTAKTADTGFTVKWGPDQKALANNPFAALMGRSSSGDATGSWHADRTHVKFSGAEEDELLLIGTSMLARDGDRDWRLRRGHFADGNKITFIPNAQALMQQLATWPLAVTHREAGAYKDRPVEVVSVTLNADQIGELMWSGCLPESLSQGNFGQVIRLVAGRANAARRAATPPDTTIDLAISLDPGTNLVHQIQVRAWTKADPNGGMLAFPAGRIAVGRAVGGEDEEEEEEEVEEEEEAQANKPLEYSKGLPKRSRKKTSVANFTLQLHNHGQQAKPELTELQKSLLH
tara:strand:- start:654 stop:1775 length:1122 start_codon:yes stop_codon:yes gene_type:complete